MQIFWFISLNLLRSFLRSDIFIKKHEFLCITFRGPALFQLLVYLISRSFQKIAKSKSVWVFVCVCVCVCVCVHVCINVTSQNNVIVATGKTQHFVFFEIDEISGVHKNRKFKKFITYTRCKLYLLEMLFHFLVDLLHTCIY